MAHKVKCVNCGLMFDRDKVPCVPVGSRRYAHADCSAYLENVEDLQKLEEYILKTLKIDAITAKIRLQLNNYRDINKYSYKGMLKALVYFHEVKGNPITGVGIIPHVYDSAQKYYQALWMTQQTNEAKPIAQFEKPAEIEIRISEPVSPIRKRKKLADLFSQWVGE